MRYLVLFFVTFVPFNTVPASGAACFKALSFEQNNWLEIDGLSEKRITLVEESDRFILFSEKDGNLQLVDELDFSDLYVANADVTYQRSMLLPGGRVLFIVLEKLRTDEDGRLNFLAADLSGFLASKDGFRVLPKLRINDQGGLSGAVPLDTFRFFPAVRTSVSGERVAMIEVKTRDYSMFFQIDGKGWTQSSDSLNQSFVDLKAYFFNHDAFRTEIGISPVIE